MIIFGMSAAMGVSRDTGGIVAKIWYKLIDNLRGFCTELSILKFIRFLKRLVAYKEF